MRLWNGRAADVSVLPLCNSATGRRVHAGAAVSLHRFDVLGTIEDHPVDAAMMSVFCRLEESTKKQRRKGDKKGGGSGGGSSSSSSVVPRKPELNVRSWSLPRMQRYRGPCSCVLAVSASRAGSG